MNHLGSPAFYTMVLKSIKVGLYYYSTPILLKDESLWSCHNSLETPCSFCINAFAHPEAIRRSNSFFKRVILISWTGLKNDGLVSLQMCFRRFVPGCVVNGGNVVLIHFFFLISTLFFWLRLSVLSKISFSRLKCA